MAGGGARLRGNGWSRAGRPDVSAADMLDGQSTPDPKSILAGVISQARQAHYNGGKGAKSQDTGGARPDQLSFQPINNLVPWNLLASPE